jgi:hypothetical protein
VDKWGQERGGGGGGGKGGGRGGGGGGWSGIDERERMIRTGNGYL